MDSPADATTDQPVAAVVPEGSEPGSAMTGAAAQNIIEVDTGADEGYQTDAFSTATTSVSSSVRDYVFENSRRYHKYKEGRYLIPNDNEEQVREDMKHALVLHLCEGKLHGAPLDDPKRILDVGTGTGIWAIDSEFKYLNSASSLTPFLIAVS